MSSATHMEYGNAAKHNADQKPSFHALLSAVELYQLANASWVESTRISKCKPIFSWFDEKLRIKKSIWVVLRFLGPISHQLKSTIATVL